MSALLVPVRRPFSALLIAALVALSTTGPSSSDAQEAESIFRSANADFEAGDYEQAALKYESLVEEGRLSADVFYNLGTTKYRLDHPGEAVLSLRRALVVDPTLPEARQNIEVIRNRTGFLEFADGEIDRFVRAFPEGAGRWLGAAFVWLALVGLAAGWTVPRLKPNRSGFIALAVTLLMLAFVAVRVDHHRDTRLDPRNFSIVARENVRAVTSPSPDAAVVIELPPGSEVRVVQASGPWRYVDIPGNLRGWVRAEQVATVWPVDRDS